MSGLTFDFTINIPVLLTVLGGFFVFSKWLTDIAFTLRDVKKLSSRVDDLEKAQEQHGQTLAALEALSNGYARENFRRVMRERD
jgi:hypothetical protein